MDKSIAASEVNLESTAKKLHSGGAAYQAAWQSAPERPSSPEEDAALFLGAIVSSGGEAFISARYVRLLIGDVSPATLYRMIASGDFPKPISVTAGRKCFVLSNVRSWIKERIEAAAEGADR